MASVCRIGLAGLVAIAVTGYAAAAETSDDSQERRIQELERRLTEMEVLLQAATSPSKGSTQQAKHTAPGGEGESSLALQELSERVGKIEDDASQASESSLDRFTLGGYGEMHANFTEGSESDKFDIHRLVLYLGYHFNDWIELHTETEIEHAYVSKDSGGEVALEQAYLDFLLADALNIRVGRVLTPLGIINSKHEPPSFYGVERPNVEKYVIPSTWSSDGIGIFGTLLPSLTYEAYVAAGLDGSNFDAKNGIRSGRIKERPSFNDVAFTGRLDYFPFVKRALPYDQTLRLGLSTYLGGVDNGNSGNDPGIDGDIQIYSSDFEYSIGKADFRGVIVHEEIDGAREIGNGTADEIFGWYLEAGYHVWPEMWKTGKLERSDAVLFARYEEYDTQHDMPSGIADDPAGNRQEWTVGTNFYPIPSLALKADFQIRDDDRTEDLDNLFNLGVGWQF